MSIRLSPKFGLNPGLTCCPRCGGEANELVLAGNAWMYKCKCGQNVVSSGYPKDPCQKCSLLGKTGARHRSNFTRLRAFDGSRDRVLASEPCETCKAEIKLHREEVAAGGVYWKCCDCHSEGVIKASSPFAQVVRDNLNIQAPAPAGVEFGKAHGCPVCAEGEGNA